MRIDNKKAHFDYELQERFEAGIALQGAEVKAIKGGHADLTGSHVRLIGNEAYLVNARVFPYQYARPEGYDEKRTRKLLLHKAEIIALKSKSEGARLTIVPTSLYVTKTGLIKLEMAIGKGRKEYDKRAVLKKRDQEREKKQGISY